MKTHETHQRVQSVLINQLIDSGKMRKVRRVSMSSNSEAKEIKNTIVIV